MKLIMAVRLSLRDVKNLIHVRLGLFGIELNKNTQRNSKQSRTKRKERESRHLGFKRKCIMGLLPPQGFRYSSNSRQSELARILRKVFTVEIYSLTVNIEKISICLTSSLAAVFWMSRCVTSKKRLQGIGRLLEQGPRGIGR